MSAIKLLLETGVAVMDIFGLRPLYAGAMSIIFSVIIIAVFWQAIRNR